MEVAASQSRTPWFQEQFAALAPTKVALGSVHEERRKATFLRG